MHSPYSESGNCFYIYGCYGHERIHRTLLESDNIVMVEATARPFAWPQLSMVDRHVANKSERISPLYYCHDRSELWTCLPIEDYLAPKYRMDSVRLSKI